MEKSLVARKAASRRLSSVFARRFHSWVVGLTLVPVTRILARFSALKNLHKLNHTFS
ncbi:hypothetical protein HanPSC8_Chr04g0148661 [Helianthus annuus]|nr:hypothetical protein HanPSC8_Chr04g0148661 [Helianthus annuus]